MENNWIEIGESLPPVLTEVLVACSALNGKDVKFGFVDGQGKWSVSSEKGNAAQFITHWMAKPELPY